MRIVKERIQAMNVGRLTVILLSLAAILVVLTTWRSGEMEYRNAHLRQIDSSGKPANDPAIEIARINSAVASLRATSESNARQSYLEAGMVTVVVVGLAISWIWFGRQNSPPPVA